MKTITLFSLCFAIGMCTLTNKQQFCNRVMTVGLQSTVTSNTTVCNILTCWEPNILARQNISALGDALLKCIMSESGSYYAKVLSLYNTMNACIGGDTLTMLKYMGKALSTVISNKYTTMVGKLKTWSVTNKLANATVLNKWYIWMLNQTTDAFINNCCTTIKNITKTYWGCSKDSSKGGKAFSVTPYKCANMTPSASLLG